MKLSAIIFLLLLAGSVVSQSKQDYNWFFGKDQVSGPEFGAIHWDFNEQPFIPSTRDAGLEFDRNNASISTKEGELLFYSNGCAVANRLHQMMPNGDSINAGEFFDVVWQGDCGNGYPGRQDITILPDPKNLDGYYLIHKPDEFEIVDGDVLFTIEDLKYSYIDMTLDEGLGDVTEKNVTFAAGNYLSSYLTSIAHANGKDWWIINPDRESNLYHTFLLDSSGFQLVHQQYGDISFGINSPASGDAKFSPDGKMYAYYNKYDGLFLYDFDRATGLLSNFRNIDFPEPTDIFFYSCEFSPNSRYLYLMESHFLYQVDTWAEDLEASLLLIDEFNGVPDPIPSRFFISTLGPDCRIYIRGGGSSNSFHVVDKPNERGVACDFVQQGVRLPFISATGSFPNFPRFRVDEEEKCDPSITSLFGETVWYRRDLTTYPNPVSDYLTIELPEELGTGRLYVLNIDGKLMWEGETSSLESELRLDMSGYREGTYSVEYVPVDNKERRIWTSKVVVVR